MPRSAHVAAVALAAPLPGAHGATMAVNETADELNGDRDCSAREAVRSANLDAAVGACSGAGLG